MFRGDSSGPPRGSLGSYRGPWRGPRRGPQRGRGISRGRGSWRGRGDTHIGEDRASNVATKEVPFGRLVAEFDLEDSTRPDTTAEDIRITNCRYAASYSIAESNPPTVVVPAQPAVWSPPELPAQLPPDRGDFFRDQNGANFPNYPMQPSVQAIFSLDGAFDPSSIDIMGCASSLGEIIRFSRSVESTFRFNVEMVGDTLFLVRNHKDELIPDVRGYGHAFLDNFTSHEAGLKTTKSHQRIISYDLGGLKCLVRFECDGYIENQDDSQSVAEEAESKRVSHPLSSDSIATREAGKIIPQSSILEIKTMSQTRGEINKSDHIPRLWVRQIPNFITAYHVRGSFEEVRQSSARQEWLRWENDSQPVLRKFVSFLRQLIAEVKRASHLKLELCRAGTGPLQLRERSGETREALPKYWREKWTKHSERTDDPRLSSDDDDDDEKGYPRIAPSQDSSNESDGSDDDFSLDYTACDPSCGYCGRCS